MKPKCIFFVLEKNNADELNKSLYDCIASGWKLYGPLRVVYYGKHVNDKVYIQTLVYRRTWYEYLFNKNI